VLVEPIATWVAYLMYQAKAHAIAKWPVNRPHRNPKWYEVKSISRTIWFAQEAVGHWRRREGCGTTSTTA
jgi:hypothetical protein